MNHYPQKQHFRLLFGALLVSLGLLFASRTPAVAHQPFFEDVDSTASAPWTIPDPAISLALYFTLESPNDVDYFTFTGQAGEAVLLSMTIPTIAGQENFTPTLALLGPGLPAGELPTPITAPAGAGRLIFRAAAGKPASFHEPFSNTVYWRRQRNVVQLPVAGQYVVAIWSETGQVGRYTFAPGASEVFGGDPAFGRKLTAYWTPVVVQPVTPTRAHSCPHEE